MKTILIMLGGNATKQASGHGVFGAEGAFRNVSQTILKRIQMVRSAGFFVCE